MKTVIRAIAIAAVAFYLGGCAKDMQTLGTVGAIASTPVDTGIPAATVINTANAYAVLKSGAVAFAQYCVANANAPAACSVATRRAVSKAIRSGDAARNAAEAAVANGSTVAVAVYNTLTNAVAALKTTPAPQFAANQ